MSLATNAAPDFGKDEEDQTIDTVEDECDKAPKLNVVEFDPGHVVIQGDFVTNVEFVDIVNPVLDVHLAGGLVLQQLRVELYFLKDFLGGMSLLIG